MQAYRLYTKINSEGKIIIPDYLKELYSQNVEIIILIPEKLKISKNRINRFYTIIDKYNAIEEKELNITQIYTNRANKNERKFKFD